MALHITNQGERVPVGAITAMIYGQPSTGKTSLGFTCKNALVLDFDGGAHRSQQSHLGTTIRIDSWADVEQVMVDYVPKFDTIVIDTVGSALDYIAAHVIATNPKMGTAKGTLTMQGWGELKAVTSQWTKRMNVAGKDVLFIAHHKEEKEGDLTKRRPDIAGSSYGLVLKNADFVGFTQINEANKRVIGFAPTNDYFAKDSAKLGIVEIPDLDEVPDFGATLMQRMRQAFAQQSEEHQDALQAVTNWNATIAQWSNAETVNADIEAIKSLVEPIATQVRRMASVKAKELNLVYDKKAEQYIQGAA
jgi:hypothetical protein